MKHILAILLVAILLFGCTQPGGTQAGGAAGSGAATGGTGAGSTGPGGTGAGAGAGTGGSTGGATGAAGAAGTESGGTGTETGGTDGGTGTGGGTGPSSMTTWSMETLAAMGVPVHCTVNYGGASAGNYDIYVLGQKSAMTGTVVTASGNQEFSYIFKDGKIYMPASLYAGIPGFEGCVWVSRSATEAASAQDTSVSPEAAPASFECAPDVFGEEKFATVGTECDFNTAMAAICNQVPAGAARDACLANLGIQ